MRKQRPILYSVFTVVAGGLAAWLSARPFLRGGRLSSFFGGDRARPETGRQVPGQKIREQARAAGAQVTGTRAAEPSERKPAHERNVSPKDPAHAKGKRRRRMPPKKDASKAAHPGPNRGSGEPGLHGSNRDKLS